MRKYMRRDYQREYLSRVKMIKGHAYHKWIFIDHKCRDSFYMREMVSREIDNWNPRLACSRKKGIINAYNNRLRNIKKEISKANELNSKRRGLLYPRT